MSDPISVVRGWQEALNREEKERVLQLSDPQIEIVGPRGIATGHEVLRQWLDHARVTLEPQRTFASGERVVVAQHGTWRDPENGTVMGEANVASLFRVREGRVAHYARFDDLAAALDEADLTVDDEVKEPA